MTNKEIKEKISNLFLNHKMEVFNIILIILNIWLLVVTKNALKVAKEAPADTIARQRESDDENSFNAIKATNEYNIGIMNAKKGGDNIYFYDNFFVDTYEKNLGYMERKLSDNCIKYYMNLINNFRAINNIIKYYQVEVNQGRKGDFLEDIRKNYIPKTYDIFYNIKSNCEKHKYIPIMCELNNNSFLINPNLASSTVASENINK